MLTSRVGIKGQATIPSQIRRRLNLKAGDTLAFEVRGDEILVRRIDALPRDFLALAATSFDDWNTPEADEAFRDL